jgi:predicted DNA-binding protein (UPF0251 family)
VAFCPKIKKFIPEGACASTGIVLIGAAEAEALRLKHIENLSQTAAAAKMKISQSSFQRVLQVAHKKISEALIEGKFITIAENKLPIAPRARRSRGKDKSPTRNFRKKN